jgi:hypothetical protein
MLPGLQFAKKYEIVSSEETSPLKMPRHKGLQVEQGRLE